MVSECGGGGGASWCPAHFNVHHCQAILYTLQSGLRGSLELKYILCVWENVYHCRTWKDNTIFSLCRDRSHQHQNMLAADIITHFDDVSNNTDQCGCGPTSSCWLSWSLSACSLVSVSNMESPPGKLVTSCWKDVASLVELLPAPWTWELPRLEDSLVIDRLRGAESCCRRDDLRPGGWFILDEEEGVWFVWVWSADLLETCDGVEVELDGLLLLLLLAAATAWQWHTHTHTHRVSKNVAS